MLFAIRSDAYNRLEIAPALAGLRQETFLLLPMPRGAYQSAIEGPAANTAETDRRLAVKPRLTVLMMQSAVYNFLRSNLCDCGG